MSRTWLWLRSLLFVVQMYAAMPVLAVAFTPPAIFDRRWAIRAVHTYCRWVRWSAAHMIGLRSELRGTPPEGAV
ncbi:MAG: 1-acyl-sn-glycerol-3-phosphate acyltransferase, partial [Alphaproteobacteria bacterium HGW-Alphaproteobacteria-2]